MTHMTDDEFRNEIEAFLSRTGLAPSRFGDLSCGDPNFISDLRAGEREFKRSTMTNVRKWMHGFDAGSAFAAAGSGSSEHAPRAEAAA